MALLLTEAHGCSNLNQLKARQQIKRKRPEIRIYNIVKTRPPPKVAEIRVVIFEIK
jgi:hypothetical protein